MKIGYGLKIGYAFCDLISILWLLNEVTNIFTEVFEISTHCETDYTHMLCANRRLPIEFFLNCVTEFD